MLSLDVSSLLPTFLFFWFWRAYKKDGIMFVSGRKFHYKNLKKTMDCSWTQHIFNLTTNIINKYMILNILEHVCYYIDPQFSEFWFILLFWHRVRLFLFSHKKLLSMADIKNVNSKANVSATYGGPLQYHEFKNTRFPPVVKITKSVSNFLTTYRFSIRVVHTGLLHFELQAIR